MEKMRKFTKPEGNRPLGRLRHGWGDNIKINFKNII
jgi:hypothetical protein